ncbi:MAG: right-handed parallel beta-helix repeat-containing protein [Mucilaginibacter sp.]
MKPLLFFVLFLICFRSYGQHQYFFSNSGNDNNPGSSTAPFKSINRFNRLTLKPGDQVFFHRGDTFPGTMIIHASGTSSSPIIINSYGQGPRPVITGAVQVTNWKRLAGTNIWQATIPPQAVVTDLYVNGRAAPLARYPKADAPEQGYLPVASHSGKTQITSGVPISGNWVGAELVYNPNQWLMEKCKVTGQHGSTFTFVRPDNRDITDNWGFFLQNHINALTRNGEWCVDTARNIVSMYYANDNPNNKNIEVTNLVKCIGINSSSNVIVQNLTVEKAAIATILGYNISSVTIQNMYVDNSGQEGIKVQDRCDNIVIANNTINHTNNNAIIVSDASNFRCVNNTIKNTALKAGRGVSSTGEYSAIEYTSDIGHAVIEGNRIDSVGYLGIYFTGDNIVVQKNFITNYCLVKSDGGGIYTWNGAQKNNTNITIANNIILGRSAGLVPIIHIRPHIDGIYLDDCSRGITISNNTVANCPQAGIYLHGASNTKVIGNTCYNNLVQLSLNISDACDVVNDVAENNILFSTSTKELAAIFGWQRNKNSDYGKFDNNLYVNPDVTKSILSGFNEEVKGTYRVSLMQWKGKSAKDPKSQSMGGNDIYNHDIQFVYNSNNQPKQIRLNGNYRDLRNNTFNGQIILQPFTSAILIKTN